MCSRSFRVASENVLLLDLIITNDETSHSRLGRVSAFLPLAPFVTMLATFCQARAIDILTT